MTSQIIKQLKIPNNKFIKCSSPPPRSIEWEEYKKVQRDISTNLKKFLAEDFYDSFEDFIFFKTIYKLQSKNKLYLPKTSRLDFKFGEAFENREKVYQIGSYAGRNGKVELIYKIPILDFKKIQENIKIMINEIDKIKDENSYKSSAIYKNFNFNSFIKNANNVHNLEKIRVNIQKNQLVILRLLSIFENEKIMNLFEKNVPNFSGTFLDTGPYLSIMMEWNEFELINKVLPWIFQKEDTYFDLNNIDSSQLLNLSNAVTLPTFSEIEDYPLIGVIDSGCFFASNSEKFLIENIDLTIEGGFKDFEHGSTVCNLISFNDDMNNSSKDGLGNFRVRNYQLLSKASEKEKFSSVEFSHLMSKIDEIVSLNSHEIKVWNISFGALKNPWSPDISLLGTKLDFLANKYNVLFIVASGNNAESKPVQSLNSPADSVNALSVGCVFLDSKKIKSNNFSSYGQNLRSLKPEISYFGGPNNIEGDSIVSGDDKGLRAGFAGTSYATPRIARIAAWLIKKLNFTPMQAKSFIIANSNKINRTEINSLFGVTNKPNFENYISGEIELNDTKNYVVEFDFTGIDKVEISYCYMIDPFKNLGLEYSINEVELKIISHENIIDWEKKIFREKKRNKTFKNSFKVAGNIEQILNIDCFESNEIEESNLNEDVLIKSGKYHNSRKKTFNFKNKENKEILLLNNYKTGFLFKRQDLFNIKNTAPLKIGFTIRFFGENLNWEKIYKNNNWLAIENVSLNTEVLENIN